MNFQEKQQEYARLIVENGAAIQKGQELVLRCPAECWAFGRMIVKAGYEAGAKEVIVHWGDDEVARLRYEYAPMEVFEKCSEVARRFHEQLCRKWSGIYCDHSRESKCF